MEYNKIQTTLTDKLKELPNLPELFEEGQDGYLQSEEEVSTRSSDYCRTTLLPLKSFPAAAGVGGYDQYPVLFQIDFFHPRNSGVKFSNNFSDDVIRLFKRGQLEIEPGLCFTIESAYRNGTTQYFTNYSMTSVIVEGYSLITRPV